MDRLRKCIDALRRLAKGPDDPDGVVFAEQTINDYLRKEIEALRRSGLRSKRSAEPSTRRLRTVQARIGGL